MTRLPSELPQCLLDWATRVTSDEPHQGPELDHQVQAPTRNALARVLGDPQVAKQLARVLPQLEATHGKSAPARLTIFLELAASAAASLEGTQDVSAANMVERLDLLASRCRSVAKDLRELDNFPAGPNFEFLPRRSYTWEMVRSVGEREQSNSIEFIPIPDYMERLAQMLTAEAHSWQRPPKAPRRRIGGTNANRNRLIDGIVEVAYEHLEEVPYALISSIVTILANTKTDEKTVRDRSQRFSSGG